MDWSWDVFFTYLVDRDFALAALATLAVTCAAQALATVIGIVLALAALSRSRILRLLSAAYLWIWRGTPPLIQLLVLYFGLPQLGIRLSVLEAGLIGLSCYGGAYMSEIVRAAIRSVDDGQVQAARSLGFGRLETLGTIVLPQALRVALPPFGNEFASMLRTSALLSVISFEELLRVTTLAINDTFRPAELYAVAALYYLVMTSLWMILQHGLERRMRFDGTRALTDLAFPAT